MVDVERPPEAHRKAERRAQDLAAALPEPAVKDQLGDCR
jgi:hypothetical protein